MEGDQETPLFWNNSDQHHRPRRRQSSFFQEPWLLIMALLLILMVLMFLLPSLYSFVGKVFRRNIVTKSFDSFSLFLVLVSILFGILSRNTPVPDDPIPARLTPKWYEQYSGHTSDFSGGVGSNNEQRSGLDQGNSRIEKSASDLGFRRLRSSSSYPDLRQDSWVSSSDRRVYDDIDLYRRRSSDNNRRPPEGNVGDSDSKTTEVDSFVASNTHKPKRKLEAISAEKKKTEVDWVLKPKEKIPTPPPPPPPPPPLPPPRPPPQPPLTDQPLERKSKRNLKLKTGGSKDIASAFALLYNHRSPSSSSDKKKSKKKNESFSSSSSSSHPYSSSPPPPPPPPPPSVFQNWFKKDSKSRRKDSSRRSKVHSISVSDPPKPPPMPPPPLLSRNRENTRKENLQTGLQPWKNDYPIAESKPRNEIVGSRDSRPEKKSQFPRPPLPPIIRGSEREIEVSVTVNDLTENSKNKRRSSSSIPLPPPPPPPFWAQKMKFTVQGDYVRIQGQKSSNSESNLPTETQESSFIDGGGGDGDGNGSIFCPSPDVNTKADTFIAKVHAGLRLQKLNSIKEGREKAEEPK